MRPSSQYNASEFLSAHVVTPLARGPAFFNLEFKPKSDGPARIGGCGLYCVSYRGQAIYLGKFLGTESNPFSGDLQRIRWERHIASLTMRGHKVSLGKRVLSKLRKESRGCALASDLCQADLSTMTHYRGYHASYNRVRFAAQYWNALQGDPAEFLHHFDFGYVRFEPHEFEGQSNVSIWDLVSTAEKRTREQLRLCCNGESDFEFSVKQDILSLPIALDLACAQMEGLQRERLGRPSGPSSTRHRSSQSGEPVGGKLPRSRLPSHLKSDAAMEKIEESLPTGWRTEWLERLRLAIPSDGLEVHATETGSHGDVRVRAVDLKRQRNIFTMAFRPGDRRFSCRILLSEEYMNGCPGVEIRPPSGTDPLPTGFIFDPGASREAAFEGLLRLIAVAHQQAKEAGL